MTITVFLARSPAGDLRRTCLALEATPRLQVVGTAGSLQQTRHLLARTRLEVLVCDLRLADGSVLALLEDLAQGAAPPRILVLTSGSDDPLLLDALRAGADSYCIDRGDALCDIGQAVAQVVRDEAQIDAILARRLLAQFEAQTLKRGFYGRVAELDLLGAEDQARDNALDAQERELVTWIAQGRSFAALARERMQQPSELRQAVRGIYHKLQCDWRLRNARAMAA
jgi:DNA-binding NarL/FixJ family response regulator